MNHLFLVALVAAVVILELLAPRSAEMTQATMVVSALALIGMLFVVSYKVIQTRKLEAKTGPEGMVGAVGTVISDLTPKGGEIQIEGQIWKAKSTDAGVKEGEQVEVVGREGLTLRVKPCGRVA